MQTNISYDNILKDILYDNLNQKRKCKKIKLFIFLFFLILFFSFIFYNNKNVDHIAVVEVNGLISDKSQSNAKSIIVALNQAFSNSYSKAIILKINSPGGTPVQSNIIYTHIKRLKKNYVNKPVYAVIEDIGTSGAYLIAVSADKIYCDKFSLVGSIGVLINSFGFVDAINRLGVERRIYKAGKYKVIMDPFLEKNLDEEKILQCNLNLMHKNFIDIVKENRYKKNLILDDNDIFSGKFWIGEDALSLGLVDGLSDIYSLSSDIIKLSSLIYYNHESSIFNILRNIKS